MLDPRRARLWDALGLGPQWVLRDALAPADAAAPPAAGAPEPGGAHPPAAAVRQALPVLPEGRRVALQGTGDLRSQAIAALDWDGLRDAVAGCTACPLHRSRTQTVFGVGHRQAHWMIVGEAPGAEEDARGEPFVGQAGRLLDNMLAAVGRSRGAAAPEAAVFIANVLKCRPPGNRNPEPAEVEQCAPFLRRQVQLVQPRVIVVMGRFAVQALLQTEATIASLRGRVHRIEIGGRTFPAVVTYHPAYLLRNLADKAKSWADLNLALDVYAAQAPARP